MLWLFGQIWVWLLIAFLLGAAVATVIFTAVNRRRPEAAPEAYDDEVGLPVDETQYIPASDYEEPYEDPPAPEYPPRPQNDWPPEDVDVTGHREGHLPTVTPQPARGDDVEDPAWPTSSTDWPR
jgi:hypothetical protein